MNKQQALEKLAALEAETKAIRAIIEAPEPAGSLLPNGQDCGFWFPDVAQREILWFNDQNQRDEYMKALETMLDLRRQPGSEAPCHAHYQYVIKPNEANILFAEMWVASHNKQALISPCFASKAQAVLALDKVGHERIRHMFNTLHGVK